MKQSLQGFCMKNGRKDLLRQWDSDKNGSLTPDDITYGSHRRVWWICEKGHHWLAEVKSRCTGAGCPVCASRRVAPGENDLMTVNPELAAQWHPTKNGEIRPSDVVVGAHRKAWWLCDKGHEWEASIVSRARGAGCPVCAGKVVIPGENDLKHFYPDIAAEWHPSLNGGITPEMVTPYSNRRVWWKCRLGHDYQAAIGARTQGSGCPYCSGRKTLPGFNDIATLEPEVSAQWHPTLNGMLTPQMVTPGSHKKVWWQCSAGHIWPAVISSRTGRQRCGCPVCAGKVNTKRMERYTVMLNHIPAEINQVETIR